VSAPEPTRAEPHPLLLSVDFEDWHQLVRRRLGVERWDEPGPALARQTDALLELLDELGVRATFFVLGMAARAHPGLVERVADRGHEIGCHGDRHLPVHSQSRVEFAHDLRQAKATIEQLSGRTPIGYRAPAFSITRTCPWAYDVLVEEGFRYDSSQHDTPRIRQRVIPATPGPHMLECGSGMLWEFPLAVWRGRHGRVPVGGASYWAILPTALVLRGLAHSGGLAGLYLHPHELDPEPLSTGLPPGARAGQRAHGLARGAQRNLARRRASAVLREIAGRHPLITYGEAHARLADRAAART
jgi:polysaccharide deacetylase family protein (PEP-CTERM system associated)